MTHYEIDFPITPSDGTDGGPGFDTNLIGTDSGQETAIQRRSQSQWQFNAAALVRTKEDVREVYEFYLRVGGVSGSFLFKDFLDYTSTETGRLWGDDSPAAIAETDQAIGVGDGSETTFQLVKTYGSTTPQYVRTITKPVSGTVLVALDGVLKTEGVDYTVDYTTGAITFGTAPGLGVVVSAGYEFRVPVRFGVEVDRLLRRIINDFGSASIPQIPLVEKLNPSPADERLPFRGAKFVSMSANRSLSMTEAGFYCLSATTTSLKAILPDKTALPTGIALFAVKNAGANAISVRDAETDTAQFSLTSGASKIVCLGLDSGGNKVWWGF